MLKFTRRATVTATGWQWIIWEDEYAIVHEMDEVLEDYTKEYLKSISKDIMEQYDTTGMDNDTLYTLEFDQITAEKIFNDMKQDYYVWLENRNDDDLDTGCIHVLPLLVDAEYK